MPPLAAAFASGWLHAEPYLRMQADVPTHLSFIEATMSMTSEIPNVRPTETGAIVNRILVEAKRQLLASPFAAIKQLQADFYDGVLVVRGTVPTFYTRQVALALLMNLPGVEKVDDRIVVHGLTAGQ